MAKTNCSSKLLTVIQLVDLVPAIRAAGKSIVATSGVFDLWHDGHAYYLEDAGLLGDILIVGVDADKLVSSRKGPNRPIYNEDLRLNLVAACGAVDYALLMEDWSIFMRLVSPHVIVISPTTEDGNTINQHRLALSVGAEIRLVESRSNAHTSDIIRRIINTCA